MVIFCFVYLCKCAEIPTLSCFLNINQNLPKNGPPKMITFHILLNTGSYKSPVLLQPPLDQTSVFFNLFFETKIIDVEQEHNLRSIINKDKKGCERKNKTGTPQKKIDEKQLCNWIFCCCFFHETKAKKTEKQRKRQKQGTKRKRRRKTRRKKQRK